MEVNVYPYIHAYAESYAFVCSWLFACMADERRQVFGILIGRWHLAGYNSTSLTSTQLVASDIMNSMATICTVQTAPLKHWGEGIESNCAQETLKSVRNGFCPSFSIIVNVHLKRGNWQRTWGRGTGYETVGYR